MNDNLGEPCYWCGRLMNYRDPYSRRYRTRDHLVPRSKGGTIIAKNIVMACAGCNVERGNSTDWVPFGDRPPEVEPAYALFTQQR